MCEIGNQTMSGGPDVSVKEYYESLGAENYLAMDVNKRKDAIIVDLNYPLVYDVDDTRKLIEVGGEFCLVTNNGTSEHLFNQGQVFENIHNLCRLEGIMLHILPLTPWLNHGFYNYNPILFRDLARVNNYDIKFFWIANRWNHKIVVKPEQYEELFLEKNPDKLIAWIQEIYMIPDRHKDVFNVVCFQKKTAAPFVYPIQGKYVSCVEGDIKSV